MMQYTYVIVGGGMTADAAVGGIRELDSGGSIGVFSDEPDPPYSRPPLTKALWKGKPLDSIWRNTADAHVDMHLGRRIVHLNPDVRKVTDDRGVEYGYERLLLATGGTPRRFPSWSKEAIYFRTLEDYRKVRAFAAERKSFAVIGGGFIGSEIAAALAAQQCRVVSLFPEAGIGARLFPADLARFLVSYFRDQGVDVRPREEVAAVRADPSGMVVEAKSGFTVSVDVVVAGAGIEPNIGLAECGHLAIGNGIVVDERLRTSNPHIFAAGDVAEFELPGIGRRRIEHEDNALTMGRAAGRSMAGDDTAYSHQPYFYSDLFDLGYEAVGDLDPSGTTVADWTEPFRKGVVYYLAGDKVRGVLLWNTWNRLDAARSLIAEAGPFQPTDLKGRL